MLNNIQMDTVTNNILNMVIFDKMKIGNPIIDMIVTSICLSLITILIKKINNYYLHLNLDMINVVDIFYKKNIITNIYMNSNNNKDIFIEKILQNKHI